MYLPAQFDGLHGDGLGYHHGHHGHHGGFRPITPVVIESQPIYPYYYNVPAAAAPAADNTVLYVLLGAMALYLMLGKS